MKYRLEYFKNDQSFIQLEKGLLAMSVFFESDDIEEIQRKKEEVPEDCNSIILQKHKDGGFELYSF